MMTPLTPRERVQRAVAGGDVDRIPRGELTIADSSIGVTGAGDVHFDDRVEFAHRLGLDLVTLAPECPSSPDHVPSAEETTWPDLERWRDETPLFVFALLDGAFERAMRAWGAWDFLMLVVRDPASLRPYIDRVETYNVRVARDLVSRGIDGIILADDIGTQNGLFARPQLIRAHFIASLARQVEAIRSCGVPLLFHSDGNYLAVVGDLIAAGFSGLQCLEGRAGMTVERVREQSGDGVCLWGHLEVQDIDRTTDPSERAALAGSIRAAAAAGPLILGTTGGIFEGTDVPLLEALYAEL